LNFLKNCFNLVERLKNLGKYDLAEELSGQYQGDIILSPAQLREYEMGSNAKTGLIFSRNKWAGGNIPFRIVEADYSEKLFQIFKELNLQRLEHFVHINHL
jgi:hypothetical protein